MRTHRHRDRGAEATHYEEFFVHDRQAAAGGDLEPHRALRRATAVAPSWPCPDAAGTTAR